MGDAEQILIVDDDQDQLDFIKYVLEEGGFRVTQSCGAKEGLKQAQLRQFDAIICDLVMPEMSGAELINAVRRIDGWATTPAILLTAGNAGAVGAGLDVLHSTQFKANAFCLKRDAAKFLVSKVRTLLGS